MIKINLLGDETVIDTSGTWLVIGYALSLVATLLVLTLLYFSASSNIQEFTAEQETLEQHLTKLKETTKEVHLLEARKKELADKTTVIATLKKAKLGPVHILDDLNSSLPDRAWITEVRESAGLMRISGYALDNQTIAAFMKTLDGSTYFDSIDLGESREVERDGARIKEFTLNTKVSYSGVEKKILERQEAARVAAEASPSASVSPSASASPVVIGTPSADSAPVDSAAPSPSVSASESSSPVPAATADK